MADYNKPFYKCLNRRRKEKMEMADAMQFPESWKQFLHDYEFRDSSMEYTNGSMLVPSFRVEQMIEHYFRDAVPVVRCRECRYYAASGATTSFCIHPGGMQFTSDSDYCSRGQRRDQSADVPNMEGGNEHE